jgi:hypothetical protein
MHEQLREQRDNFLSEREEMKASYAVEWKKQEQLLKGKWYPPYLVDFAHNWRLCWREYCVDAEEKLAHTRNAKDALSWKNAYHQEQANCEKLSKLIKDTDVEYKKTLALNRDMGEALTPVMDSFVLLEPAINPPPSFLGHARQLADKINEYLQQTVRQTVEQLLPSVQAFNPNLDLEPVGRAVPDECSQEEF